jgi:hypothetical protein
MNTIEEPSALQSNDLSRNYGSNWTATNVATLFEWMSIAAFNIRCLELSIHKHRTIIRNHTVIGLILSTLSGTISVSQFGITDENGTVSYILKGLFTTFAFTIAIMAGFLKVFQIQELLEQYIKLKQDWIVFSTAIASELQLPIELRRDALFIIIKNKTTYLDLLKSDVEVTEDIKVRAEKDLPHAANVHLDLSTLPRIIMNICIQELEDMKSANVRNKDRFSSRASQKTIGGALSPSSAPTAASAAANAVPESVTLTIAPLPKSPTLTESRPPSVPPA